MKIFALIVVLIFMPINIISTETKDDEPQITITPVTSITVDDDEVHTWASSNYPEAYPPKDEINIIAVKSGYWLSITVETLDLDGASGDFLLIKPGSILKDDNKGKIFTYQLKEPRKYLIYSNNAYMSFHVFGKNENKNKGFVVKYQRVGEEVTTTEEPTTGITWPTPSGSDSIYLTVYVSSKKDNFENSIAVSNFKTAVAEMATEYCTTNNFPLAESITTQNTQIYYMVQCPFTWPDSEICVKIRFALPVFLKEDPKWSGYQIINSHLKLMWEQLAEKYLQKYNMYVYIEPDNDSSLVKWIVIICIIVILFLILLFLLKMLTRNFSPLKHIKRRSSDTSGIIKNEARMSKMSLGPHPLQVTPPFFDNDYDFQQFEPDVGIKSRTYDRVAGDYPLSEDDSDNDIIFTNFSNSRNNIPEQDSKSGMDSLYNDEHLNNVSNKKQINLRFDNSTDNQESNS